ncbi:U3 snoRNP protein [Tieghemiomyces parasiticus]|uniref:U3 small nucleolar RNA-associated protein 22 n=1 Tax=Tieghemiomyces parasiticus TaxID=78921 RepID=A0A9W8ACC7_9FUNG|nr:U3 snoRNP protein [Tieghemiomyces parasiticus]
MTAPTNPAELYGLNLLQMQIDELLGEVRVPHDSVPTLQAALKKIKALVEATEAMPNKSYPKAVSQLKKKSRVIVPYPVTDKSVRVGFQPPTKVNVVGSYAFQGATRTRFGFNVDVVVPMPDELFATESMGSQAYFSQRAFYLSVLAAALQADKDAQRAWEIKFTLLRGDPRRPIITVRAKPASQDSTDLDFSASNATIRILPALGAVPTWLRIVRRPDTDLPALTDAERAIITEDTVYTTHLATLHRAQQDCPCFRDAASLARVWFSQLGYDNGHDTQHQLGAFHWSMILVHLLQAGGPRGSRLLSNQLSAYQLFRGTLNYLATHDFAAQPVSLADAKASRPVDDSDSEEEEGNGEGSEADTLESHQNAALGGLVLLDPSGRVNLLRTVPTTEMERVRFAAANTMAQLDDQAADHFMALFLQAADAPLLAYDHTSTLARLDAPLADVDPATYASAPFPALVNAQRVQTLLKTALGTRVQLVHVACAPRVTSWDLAEVLDSDAEEDEDKAGHSGTLGLILNGSEANRVVDRGPSPEDPEAYAAFRAIWGDRAELRRFKDGSIVESVVWSSASADSTHLVIVDVVAYLLRQHFSDQAPAFDYPVGRLYNTIQSPIQFKVENHSANQYVAAIQSFGKFVEFLRSLRHLPLDIKDAVPFSAGLRYTSLFPPTNLSAARQGAHLEPIEAHLVFEESSKWPRDLVALQKTKVAFYLALQAAIPRNRGKLIVEQLDLYQGAIGTGAALDVYTGEGYPVRLRIHLPMEEEVLRKVATDSQRPLPVAAQAALVRVYEAHQTLYTRRPWLHGRVQALALVHPVYGQTVRLLKRWAGVHLLGELQVPAELWELLAAAVFLRPAPWTAPGSAVAGFFRTLDLVARFNWKAEPLIVDFNEEMTPAMRQEVEEQFRLNRTRIAEQLARKMQRNTAAKRAHPDQSAVAAAQLTHGTPTAAMFIATVPDLASRWWTAHEPRKVVLHRIVALARATLASSQTAAAAIDPSGVATLASGFVTPLTDYDVVIHFDPHCNPQKETRFDISSLTGRSCLEVNTDSSDAAQQPDKGGRAGPTFNGKATIQRIGLNPISEFVRDLQRIYADTLLFFYDTNGGLAAGAIWLPTVRKPQHFRADLALNTMPIDGATGPQVAVNGPAILSEISRLGAEMIVDMDINRPPPSV